MSFHVCKTEPFQCKVPSVKKVIEILQFIPFKSIVSMKGNHHQWDVPSLMDWTKKLYIHFLYLCLMPIVSHFLKGGQVFFFTFGFSHLVCF